MSAVSLFLLLLLQKTCHAAAADGQVPDHYCEPSSCGEIPIIKPPFRLTTDPESCSNLNLSLSCESNATVLYRGSRRYYVKAINYNNFTIRLVADGVVKGNCSSLPAQPMSPWDFSVSVGGLSYHGPEHKLLTQGLTLISCDNPVVHSSTTTPPPPLVQVETSPCIQFGPNSASSSTSYAVIGWGAELSDLPDSCRVEMTALLPIASDYYYNNNNVTFEGIHRQLEYGFEVSWLPPPTESYTYRCPYRGPSWIHDPGKPNTIISNAVMSASWIIRIVILSRLLLLVLGTPVVVALLICKWRRRHRSIYHSIEEFLQNQTHIMPIRYSYYHIKKMTSGLKDKLGQGGFGSVYKAKLRGGSIAAVKLLDTNNKKPSTTAAGRRGQDFMNEVATIGRIHHANVVRMIGYCSEGSKQALVYEFMPNGSLDKHISHQNGGGGDQSSSTTPSLSLEQLYRISLGVARGIEYLHRGCVMQILHFDIKPHNILLDEDFTPKVSDFGLARLNQAGRDNDIATLTAARGTIGYMAPELFYKNIGGVSYKADVYSFGMLLLEMVGKRGHLIAAETDQSSAYFPSWVHNQVSTVGTRIAVGEVTEEEDNIAKKMVMVGLWCIQMKPDERPPMNKVLEMLEGDLDSLPVSPKPLLYPRGEAARKSQEGSSFVSSSEYTKSVISTQCDG
ncbi:unnamed protein product [Linum tenue]|uniref:Protein kinase domain-containing protein n=1 Tax=Linum tenue TaxID=586396 RepID=A0AAV0IHR4_9ROSI|nr:unnamed protein product [Linum tenue]